MPHLPDAAHAWLTLAMSSTLAGNLTVLGSVANLIVVERARREVQISFWEYAKAGVPLTIVTLAVGCGSWMSAKRICYTGGLLPQVSRAGEWFLHSGIQNRTAAWPATIVLDRRPQSAGVDRDYRVRGEPFWCICTP